MRLHAAFVVLFATACGGRTSSIPGPDAAAVNQGDAGTTGAAGTGGVAGTGAAVTETSSCEKGRTTYAQSRDSLIEKYSSVGCKVDSDCALVYEANACVANCGTAIATTLAESLRSNLDSTAAANCSTCPTPTAPPCAPLVAVCSNGKCTPLPGPQR